MGYNAVDNGFLRFDHVRIPEDAMLMAHSKVLNDRDVHPSAGEESQRMGPWYLFDPISS